MVHSLVVVSQLGDLGILQGKGGLSPGCIAGTSNANKAAPLKGPVGSYTIIEYRDSKYSNHGVTETRDYADNQ